jgi:hypothetical protein
LPILRQAFFRKASGRLRLHIGYHPDFFDVLEAARAGEVLVELLYALIRNEMQLGVLSTKCISHIAYQQRIAEVLPNSFHGRPMVSRKP